jgi:hypothetical protein
MKAFLLSILSMVWVLSLPFWLHVYRCMSESCTHLTIFRFYVLYFPVFHQCVCYFVIVYFQGDIEYPDYASACFSRCNCYLFVFHWDGGKMAYRKLWEVVFPCGVCLTVWCILLLPVCPVVWHPVDLLLIVANLLSTYVFEGYTCKPNNLHFLEKLS